MSELSTQTSPFHIPGDISSYNAYYEYEDAGGSDVRADDVGAEEMAMFAGMTCEELLNLSRNVSVESEELRSSEYVTTVAFIIICVIGLIGNGLVLFVIFGGKETTKTVANIYIWNLALADLLFLLTLPFAITQRLLLNWPFGDFVCKVTEALRYHNYYASVCFLTAMSVDRYFAVVHVVNSVKHRTSRNTFFVCSAIWILSFIMVVPVLMNISVSPAGLCSLDFSDPEAWSQYGGGGENFLLEDKEEGLVDYVYDEEYYGGGVSDSNNLTDCYKKLFDLMGNGVFVNYNALTDYASSQYVPDYEGELQKGNLSVAGTNPIECKHPEHPLFRVYLYFSFVSGFGLPCVVMTLCYALIVLKILKPTEMKARSNQADRKRRKVTRMVIAMVVCFFICWLPFHVFHLLKIKGVDLVMDTCHVIRDATFCLAFINSCLNPILYTFLGHNFGERLQRSMTITLRSLSLSTFTKYTSNNNTTSRAETHHPSCKRTEPNIYETIEKNKSKIPSFKKPMTETKAMSEQNQKLIEEAG